MSAASTYRLSEALGSFRRLEKVIHDMSRDEIVQAIALEEESGRRKAILDRLYRQARVLAQKSLNAELAVSIDQAK